jgi:hypothetical protein
MTKLKFNTNYTKNEKRLKEIKKIVDKMIAEKVNTKPYDFLFRRNSEAYPRTNHEVLGLPGIFKQIENPNVFTVDEKSLQQDLVESVLPDGEIIMQESTIGVEQQAYLITPEKTEAIYSYKHHNIKKHEKPSICVIVTNIDYKTDELLCKINSEFFTIKIIFYNQDRIDKILNTLSKKDYSTEEMSEADFLNLVHCIIFSVKDNAKETIEKIVKIFVSCEKIQDQHQLDLHLALKIMIKYRYNDEKEIRRLLTMITRAVNEKQMERALDYEQLVLNNKELKSDKDNLEHELAKIKAENKRLREKLNTQK